MLLNFSPPNPKEEEAKEETYELATGGPVGCLPFKTSYLIE